MQNSHSLLLSSLVMSPKRELRSSFPPKKQNMTKLVAFSWPAGPARHDQLPCKDDSANTKQSPVASVLPLWYKVLPEYYSVSSVWLFFSALMLTLWFVLSK